MTNFILFKIIGVAGLVLISIGMMLKKRTKRDIFSILGGGICLLVYSIYLKDVIFVILQSVYTTIVVFDYYKEKRKNA